MVCHGLNIPGMDVLGCQSVYSWLWVSKISEMVFFQMLYLMVMSWRFMIASSIFSMVLCGVKEFGCISFKISVLKGVSQSWLSLWRMHNLGDASWEHSDILWSVPHCGHFDSWLHPQYSLWCYVVSKNLVSTVLKFQFWKGWAKVGCLYGECITWGMSHGSIQISFEVFHTVATL